MTSEAAENNNENIPTNQCKEPWSFFHLPVEIKVKILKYLDFESFLTCRCVSQHWKEVIDTVQDDETWKGFLRKEYPKYLNYVQKSKIPIFKVLKNMASWDLQKTIDINEVVTSDLVLHFHIYRDKFIAVCGHGVKYFNVETFEQTKYIHRLCYDFNETDHMQMEVSNLGILHMYGKRDVDSFLECMIYKELGPQVHLNYRLDDDKIYFVVRRQEIWMYQWYKNSWYENFVVKLYEADIVSDINVYGLELYVITHCGKLWILDRTTMKLNLLDRFEIHPIIPYRLFDRCSTLAHMKGLEEIIEMYGNKKGVFLGAPQTTTMLEHGDLLVVGGGNRLELSSVSSLKGTEIYQPLQLNWDPALGNVCAMDIYEQEHAHNLFVLTKNFKLVKFTISTYSLT